MCSGAGAAETEQAAAIGMSGHNDEEDHIDAWQCEFCHHAYEDFDECCAHEETCEFQPGGKYEGQDPHEVASRLEAEEAERQQAEAQKQKEDAAARQQQAVEQKQREEQKLKEQVAGKESSADQNQRRGADQNQWQPSHDPSPERPTPTAELTPLQKEMARRAEERRRRAEQGEDVAGPGTTRRPEQRTSPQTPLQREMARRLEERKRREEEWEKKKGGQSGREEPKKETTKQACLTLLLRASVCVYLM